MKKHNDFNCSFASEEIAWMETQNCRYRQVKLNLRASFFQDLFLITIGVKDFKDPFIKTCQSIMEKLVQFLINTSEYQTLNSDQKQRVLARNIPLATFFVGITAEWIQNGEDQFLFIKNLLTSFTGADIFVKYLKPERTSIKTLSRKSIFKSKEDEEKFDEILKSTQQFDFLDIFDMEMFTVAMLFHTEPDENLPIFDSYRNFLLQSLQNKMQSDYDTHSIFYQFIRDSTSMSEIKGISQVVTGM